MFFIKSRASSFFSSANSVNRSCKTLSSYVFFWSSECTRYLLVATGLVIDIFEPGFEDFCMVQKFLGEAKKPFVLGRLVVKLVSHSSDHG
ncbi:hypothetical protein CERZMDRAFT_101555 [Cercospora zeae-maydis SCOH1-5]|uniref:Uncharacterized protein n=1 Tax=Cercospora zeae-maydis SCOH1-5 TaxID=717836 RepID=A0A6A6F544_9PEZI|nr:hypothetical protein CERZMDRAFT_101555 [Cercospora zeae-maydis SCOH1-5]